VLEHTAGPAAGAARVNRTLHALRARQPWLANALATVWAFLRYLAARYERDQCTHAAAALAYTTLLALVPLLTVLFITLAAFPAFQDWQRAIEAFIFRNFVPALGDQVQQYLLDFTAKARGLQAAGLGVLIVTVLAMLATIESTFNVIWGIRRRRPLLLRFLVYWAVLTLGPLLIGAGMVATSYLISLPLLSAHALTHDLGLELLTVFPLLATTAAFVLFFKLIPFRPVPLRHALAGGIVASVLFEFAKRGFALYVAHFPSQQAVYGAFATIPIFLLWIYLSWVIVLLGAEITQCLTTFAAPRGGRVRGGDDPLYAAWRVLLRLYQAQGRGESVSDRALVTQENSLAYEAINQALETLDSAGWISRDEAYRWVLLRDLGRVDLRDLFRLTPSFALADVLALRARDAADQRLAHELDSLDRWSREALAMPLADLLAAQVTDTAEPAPGP
jgi:membrane protein